MKDNKLFGDGNKLELFTNSYFQSYDYYIDTNLKFIEESVNKKGKVDILEIDIYAKKFGSVSISTTLVECKRGCTFNDLFKFSGISQLIGADCNIIVALSKQLEDLRTQASKLGIIIVDPNDLYINISEEKRLVFCMFYKWNQIKNSIISKETIQSNLTSGRRLSRPQESAYRVLREHLSIVNGKIWREPTPQKRAISFTRLMEENKDFVRKIARIQELKPQNKNSQFYIDSNELCQAAGALVIDIKISYIICAVECAILKINMSDIQDLGFIKLVEKLSLNLDTAVLIPTFLQYFINVFGGIYFDDNEDIENICSVIKITTNEFQEIVSLLQDLFVLPDINIQWGFEKDFMVTNFKYTPELFKAIGIENREKFGFETEKFVHKDKWMLKLKKWRENNEFY